MSQLRMISNYLVLIILVILVSFSAGCFNIEYGTPSSRLGEYRYIYRQYYTGPVVREIPIWVDVKFNSGDLESIRRAVSQWNFALNGYIELKIVDVGFDMEVDKIVLQGQMGGWLFMKIDSDSKIIPVGDDPKYHTIGFVDNIGGQYLYLVRDRLLDEAIFGVTMHEIGHLLGSPHIGNHLMYPYYSRAVFQCIDWVSVNEVAKYQGLPVGKLNYCLDTDGEAAVSSDSKCALIN